MAEPVAVVGSSVASLVAALETARRGGRVVLYLDPSRIGGSFGGVVVAGRRFDLGSRLFELDYEAVEHRPIEAFDPASDTHRPYIRLVADLVEELLGAALRPAAQPQMWINGGRVTCPLMTVDLAGLAASLPAQERAAIADQARSSLDGAPQPVSKDTTLEQASLHQHGERLHAILIGAICAKQHGGWRHVLATERRKLWAALFHPQTVYEAFSGQAIAFRPHRPFATTRTGQAHPFVARLLRAVRASRRIAIVPAGPLTGLACQAGRVLTLRFGDGRTLVVPAERCGIGSAPNQVFDAAGMGWRPDRMTSSVMWVAVAASADRGPGPVVLDGDADSPVLRISAARRTARHCTYAVEFGAASPAAADAADALARIGIIQAGAPCTVLHTVSGPAQVVPTAANRDAFQRRIAALGGIARSLLGGARRFGFDSLNDQIVDGLHFGATRC